MGCCINNDRSFRALVSARGPWAVRVEWLSPARGRYGTRPMVFNLPIALTWLRIVLIPVFVAV